MATTSLSILLCIIFSLLGGIHFYWFLGGIWGLEKVIPTKENTDTNIKIPKLATLLVGLTLIFFGLMYLTKSGLINVSIPNYLIKYGYWLIPFIFILRAIGDFNYVGFFKKIIHTEFAKADTYIFSPLCLTIGIIGIIIQIINL